MKIRPNNAEDVRWLLAAGRRLEAADMADWVVERSPRLAADVARVLANYMRELGDTHVGRGRPKLPSARELARMAKRGAARRTYITAVTARRIVDGDKLQSIELADFAWGMGLWGHFVPGDILDVDQHCRLVADAIEASPGPARAFLDSYARGELRRLRLSGLVRRGFQARFKEAIAKRFNISVEVLKRELAQ